MSRSLDSAVPVASIIVEKRSNEETGKSNFFPGGNLSTGCRGTEPGFLPHDSILSRYGVGHIP